MCHDLTDVLPAGVVLARDAAAAGVHGDALSRAVRTGLLTRIRPGAYVRSAEWVGSPPEQRHRAVLEAAGRQLVDPVLCLESAAVVWGLPLVGTGAGDRVHVLGPPRPDGGWAGAGTSAGVTRHAAGPGTEVVRRDGLRVSDVADTVLALAAARDLRRALPVADAALTRGLVGPDALRAGATALGRRPGSRRARVVAAIADGRSGSVGESVSRARMHLDGLERPRLQSRIQDADGVFARADFCWPEAGVVGEFDGRVKYRADGVDDPRAVEERLWAEKVREDRIRATGLRVVRWTWRDAWTPGVLSRRLLSAGVPRRPRPTDSRPAHPQTPR